MPWTSGMLFTDLNGAAVYLQLSHCQRSSPVQHTTCTTVPTALLRLLDTKARVQGPATSLAYEPAEANVMDRPPRNIATDRLVSLPLLIYSYIIMGLAESLCCLGAYLWVFTIRGVDHADIFLVDPKKNIWDSRAERNENIAPGGFNESQQAEIVRQVRVPGAGASCISACNTPACGCCFDFCACTRALRTRL